MMRGTVLALLAGLAGALPLLVTLVVPGGIFFVLLAPLPLFLAGLSLGTGAAVIAGATAGAIVGLLGGPVSAAGYLMTLGIPVAVLVRQARLSRPTRDGGTEWYPPGMLVVWLTGIGVALLAFSTVMLSGGDGLQATMETEITRTLALVLPDLPQEEIAQAAGATAPLALGIGLNTWLVLIAVNGVLAQGVLERYGRAARPAPDIADLALPRWLPLTFAGVAGVAFFGTGDLGFLAVSLALVLALPFFFAGLAVVHTLSRRTKARGAILVGFYFVLVLFSWPALLVVGLGLIDQWADLRRRFGAPAGEQEEE
jgi:hypothetical protein